MPRTTTRISLALTVAFLTATVAGLAGSPAAAGEIPGPATEKAPAAAAEGIAAPSDLPQLPDAPSCADAGAVVAPVLPAARCETDFCFRDSNCDSFCGGVGFGVCMDNCCLCAG